MQLVPLTPSFFRVFVVRGQFFSDLASPRKTLPLVRYTSAIYRDIDVRVLTPLLQSVYYLGKLEFLGFCFSPLNIKGFL